MRPLLLSGLLALSLAACGPRFSPDAYDTRAVQQMNRVEQGVVVGRREVTVRADGATGAATGGAAGGIIGAQTPGGNMAGAIGAVGGALVGGLFGTAAERVAGDTTAREYIVRKAGGDLVSVTQRDPTPLEIGARVLVIGGAQARIVPDYTEPAVPALAGAGQGHGTPGAGQVAVTPGAGPVVGPAGGGQVSGRQGAAAGAAGQPDAPPPPDTTPQDGAAGGPASSLGTPAPAGPAGPAP